MHKEELVFLHLTLFHVKRFLEEVGVTNGYFEEYDEFGVQPVHIHKSKNDHKRAIFLLCRGINDLLQDRHYDELISNPKVRELLELVEIEAH